MIIFINCKERINFVTRRTRKARKIRTERKALKVEFPPRIISMKESITINASKQFILSKMYYFNPKPIIFNPISTAKNIVKIKLNKVHKAVFVSIIPSIARITVFIITQSIIKLSKHLLRTNISKYFRKHLIFPEKCYNQISLSKRFNDDRLILIFASYLWKNVLSYAIDSFSIE